MESFKERLVYVQSDNSHSVVPLKESNESRWKQNRFSIAPCHAGLWKRSIRMRSGPNNSSSRRIGRPRENRNEEEEGRRRRKKKAKSNITTIDKKNERQRVGKKGRKTTFSLKNDYFSLTRRRRKKGEKILWTSILMIGRNRYDDRAHSLFLFLFGFIILVDIIPV